MLSKAERLTQMEDEKAVHLAYAYWNTQQNGSLPHKKARLLTSEEQVADEKRKAAGAEKMVLLMG